MITTARQLKDLIRNMSKKKSADAQILKRNYMMERFLERISLSEYKNQFILKGGMLVAAMVGLDARATMDLDATIKGTNVSVEDVEMIISQRKELHHEWLDITLYRQMTNLIYKLSSNEEKYKIYMQLKENDMFLEKPKVDMETAYGLHYPGEVLERIGEHSYRRETLYQKYMTEEDRKRYQERKEWLKEQKKRIDHWKTEKNIKQQFNQILRENRKTDKEIQSIYEFYKNGRYSYGHKKLYCKIVSSYLKDNFAGTAKKPMAKKEALYLLKLAENMYQDECMELPEITELIERAEVA